MEYKPGWSSGNTRSTAKNPRTKKKTQGGNTVTPRTKQMNWQQVREAQYKGCLTNRNSALYSLGKKKKKKKKNSVFSELFFFLFFFLIFLFWFSYSHADPRFLAVSWLSLESAHSQPECISNTSSCIRGACHICPTDPGETLLCLVDLNGLSI